MSIQEEHQRQRRLLDSTILTKDKTVVIFEDFNAVDVNGVLVLSEENNHLLRFSRPDPVNQILRNLFPPWSDIAEANSSDIAFQVRRHVLSMMD